MLRAAWFIAVNDLKLMLRQRETLVWTFLIPPLIFYFVGTITRGDIYDLSSRGYIAVESQADSGYLAEELIGRIEEQNLAISRFDADGQLLNASGEPVQAEPESDAAPSFDDFDLRIRIPAGFTASVLSGEHVRLVLENDVDDLSANLYSFRLNRAVYTVLADVLAASNVATDTGADLTALSAADIEAFRNAERSLTLEVSSSARRIPNGFEQSVPGTTVMFTLLILLTSGATQLVLERRSGVLRRLASAPIGRGTVVLGKWAGKFALAVVQIAFALSIGHFVLGVDFGDEWPMLLATLGAYTALIASLGILLGNWARTEPQAVAIGVLSANVLAALGGCFWPIELTPGYMQQLAMFLPTGWMMDAMHKLMIFERAWSEALPHLLGMSLCAWLLGMLSARRFRFA